MNFELPLITLALWFFIAQKFSNWKWVRAVTNVIFPGPLNTLWKSLMTCSFCGGFWIALALRGVTGWQTLPELSSLHIGLDWTLDALATAMLATIVALPLQLIASKVKPEQNQRPGGRPGQSQRSHTPRPQSSQRPQQSSQRTQGQSRPSGRPSGQSSPQQRPPRRPNPRGAGS